MKKEIKKIALILVLVMLVFGNTSCMVVTAAVVGTVQLAGAAIMGVATLVGTGVDMGINYAGDGDVASYDEVDTF